MSGNCLEAASVPPGWRTALNCEGGACVEAGNAPGWVLVRDTTNRGGVTLEVPAGAWREFLAAVKR